MRRIQQQNGAQPKQPTEESSANQPPLSTTYENDVRCPNRQDVQISPCCAPCLPRAGSGRCNAGWYYQDSCGNICGVPTNYNNDCFSSNRTCNDICNYCSCFCNCTPKAEKSVREVQINPFAETRNIAVGSSASEVDEPQNQKRTKMRANKAVQSHIEEATGTKPSPRKSVKTIKSGKNIGVQVLSSKQNTAPVLANVGTFQKIVTPVPTVHFIEPSLDTPSIQDFRTFVPTEIDAYPEVGSSLTPTRSVSIPSQSLPKFKTPSIFHFEPNSWTQNLPSNPSLPKFSIPTIAPVFKMPEPHVDILIPTFSGFVSPPQIKPINSPPTPTIKAKSTPTKNVVTLWTTNTTLDDARESTFSNIEPSVITAKDEGFDEDVVKILTQVLTPIIATIPESTKGSDGMTLTISLNSKPRSVKTSSSLISRPNKTNALLKQSKTGNPSMTPSCESTGCFSGILKPSKTSSCRSPGCSGGKINTQETPSCLTTTCFGASINSAKTPSCRSSTCFDRIIDLPKSPSCRSSTCFRRHISSPKTLSCRSSTCFGRNISSPKTVSCRSSTCLGRKIDTANTYSCRSSTCFGRNINSPTTQSCQGTGCFSENINPPSCRSTSCFGETTKSAMTPSCRGTGCFSGNINHSSCQGPGCFSGQINPPSCQGPGCFSGNINHSSCQGSGCFSGNINPPSCQGPGCFSGNINPTSCQGPGCFSGNINPTSCQGPGCFSGNINPPSCQGPGCFSGNINPPSCQGTGCFSGNINPPSCQGTGCFSGNTNPLSCRSTSCFDETTRSTMTPSCRGTGCFSGNINPTSCQGPGCFSGKINSPACQGSVPFIRNKSPTSCHSTSCFDGIINSAKTPSCRGSTCFGVNRNSSKTSSCHSLTCFVKTVNPPFTSVLYPSTCQTTSCNTIKPLSSCETPSCRKRATTPLSVLKTGRLYFPVSIHTSTTQLLQHVPSIVLFHQTPEISTAPTYIQTSITDFSMKMLYPPSSPDIICFKSETICSCKSSNSICPFDHRRECNVPKCSKPKKPGDPSNCVPFAQPPKCMKTKQPKPVKRNPTTKCDDSGQPNVPGCSGPPLKSDYFKQPPTPLKPEYSVPPSKRPYYEIPSILKKSDPPSSNLGFIPSPNIGGFWSPSTQGCFQSPPRCSNFGTPLITGYSVHALNSWDPKKSTSIPSPNCCTPCCPIYVLGGNNCNTVSCPTITDCNKGCIMSVPCFDCVETSKGLLCRPNSEELIWNGQPTNTTWSLTFSGKSAPQQSNSNARSYSRKRCRA